MFWVEVIDFHNRNHLRLWLISLSPKFGIALLCVVNSPCSELRCFHFMQRVWRFERCQDNPFRGLLPILCRGITELDAQSWTLIKRLRRRIWRRTRLSTYWWDCLYNSGRRCRWWNRSLGERVGNIRRHLLGDIRAWYKGHIRRQRDHPAWRTGYESKCKWHTCTNKFFHKLMLSIIASFENLKAIFSKNVFSLPVDTRD